MELKRFMDPLEATHRGTSLVGSIGPPNQPRKGSKSFNPRGTDEFPGVFHTDLITDIGYEYLRSSAESLQVRVRDLRGCGWILCKVECTLMDSV
jgi:hypothetical protein